MPEIYIPFEKGLYEAADPKLLPEGYFKIAQNVRFLKDGRVGSRFGFDFISGSPANVRGGGKFDFKHNMYITDRANSATQGLVYTKQNDGEYVETQRVNGGHWAQACLFGAPERISVAKNIKYSAVACDIAFPPPFANSSFYWVLVHDYDITTGADNGVVVMVFDRTTNNYVDAASPGFVGGVGMVNPRLLVVGNNVAVVWGDSNTNQVRWSVMAGNNLTGLAVISSGSVTGLSGRYRAFDACASDATTFIVAYEQAAGNMRWGTVLASTGVFSTVANVAITNNCEPCVVRGSSGNVAIVWNDRVSTLPSSTGTIRYIVQTIAGAGVVGTTSLDATGTAYGYPVAGVNTTNDYSFAWNKNNGSMGTFTKNLGTQYMRDVHAFSRPFTGPNNGCHLWTTNFVTAGQQSAFATYRLIDIESVFRLNTALQSPVCEMQCAYQLAMPGAYMASSFFVENRRSVASITTKLTSPSTTGSYVIPLPIRTDTGFAVDVVRSDCGLFADKLQSAHINGQQFFSGSRLCEYDGTSFYESGIMGHEYVTAVASAGGNMAAGNYQYTLVRAWYDSQGKLHMSTPSDPIEVVVPENGKVTITTRDIAFSMRRSSSTNTVYTLLYRTLVDEDDFHLLNDTQAITAPFSFFGFIAGSSAFWPTYVDTAADSTIEDNPLLYTQGDRGGLSGILANDEPPPCKYIWPGNNRLLMAGLEDPYAYQFSKLVFPGEPLTFANDPAYRGRIDGQVTGIACLDGTWYIGSLDNIFAVGGDGPDDSGSNGGFTDPAKLPSEVGFYSQKSVVETPEGLMFQGRSDRIYLLPRGGGAPQWIGQPVRDTLAAFPFISASVLIPDQNLVVWACSNTAGTAQRLITYDTRIKQWTVDFLFGGANVPIYSLDVYNGKLMINGQILETSLFADDEDDAHNRSISVGLRTGDIRPFGMTGWGRVRKMTLLAEARDVLTVFTPTMAVSYDSGKTFTDTTSWAIANIASAIGDSIEVEHMLLYPKGDTFQLQLGWTTPSPTEGIVFNGLALEAYPERGVSRQPNARRA